MSGEKIMVVDDNKEFLEELKEILVLSGYDVVAIDDAESVLDAAVNTRPNVILLDLKMPKKNGFQIAQEFKNSSDLMHIPIIAMSGYFTRAEHEALMEVCRIKTCLKKPFNPLDVIACIESVLKGE